MIFQNFGFNQNYPVAVAGTDSNAQAFITATGISGSNATAINTLVLDLKSAGVWTKLIAAYPFIGGTADTNKYNLVNPQNTDAAYRLTYTIDAGAEITHSVDGFEVKNAQTSPVDRGAYAVTYLAPSTTGSVTSHHMAMYINSDYNQSSSDPVQCGSFNSGTQAALMVSKSPNTSNRFTARMNADERTGAVQTTQAGFFVTTRNSNTISMYRNGGADEVTNTSTSGTLPSLNIWIGALNIANNDYGPTWTRFAWFSYGAGLNSTEATSLYNAVQAYNTTLGRQV
jgi:hypothetical protein